jgi:putative flippase GtrA
MPPEKRRRRTRDQKLHSIFWLVRHGAGLAVVNVYSMTHSVRGRLILFGTVGLSGFAPNLIALFLLAEFLEINYAVAAIIATQVAISWNFVLLDQFVYRQNRSGPWYHRGGQFLILNNMDLLFRIPMLTALVEFGHIGYMIATVITLVVMFALRFIATDWLIFRMRWLRIGLVPAYMNGIATSKAPIAAHED